ncbi:DUF3106 domain-containing protein [Comamonas endophytica]|uniref:DUF3106 domain-containing protein n=1 Tax=Comamonas endophytica TaxID=2949090 RepID=UPI00360B40BA
MPPVQRTESSSPVGVALASAILLALALLAGWIVPLVRQAPSALPMPAVAQAPAPGSDAPRNGLSQRRLLASGPNWGELSAAQQRVLQPLEKRWSFMGEVQKNRWMVLADSFDTLPATEQLKLRDRMVSWASLSAQQRSQARLNYAITNRMAPKDKWAQWEAYQALTEEEKRALAAKAAAARPVGAAPRCARCRPRSWRACPRRRPAAATSPTCRRFRVRRRSPPTTSRRRPRCPRRRLRSSSRPGRCPCPTSWRRRR